MLDGYSADVTESCSLCPCPGAVIVHDGVDAVLLRQTDDSTWVGLDVHGRVLHGIPRDVVPVSSFYEDTAFPAGIASLVVGGDARATEELNDLALSMISCREQCLGLIRGALSAASGPLAPALPHSSVAILEGLTEAVEDGELAPIRSALLQTAEDQLAWTSLRLADHKASWMR